MKIDSKLLLVDSSVLPSIYSRVVQAKRLLSTGEAKNVADATRLTGISRGAYYKYKDSVFIYNDRSPGRIVNLHAILYDKQGVLSSLINRLTNAGANILTLNQNLPIDGLASVTVAIRTDWMEMSLEELLLSLGSSEGVRSIEQIRDS